jgi:hypothetical protein
MSLSAINNSSIDPAMSLDDLLRSADERLVAMNRDRSITTGELRSQHHVFWKKLVEAAKRELPEAIRPFVRASRDTNRDDFPTGISVAIDLPGCERIHFGPWAYNDETEEYSIEDSWRNKPFEVGGGNREEFGDLLDAIARAREIYQITQG